MSFRVWLRRWIRSFYRLIMSCTKPYKSDKQRQKERERRQKAKHAPYRPFKKKRKYNRHRSGNYKVLNALCSFSATSIGLFLIFPFGLIDFGYKNLKRRRKSILKRRPDRITSKLSKRITKTSSKRFITSKSEQAAPKSTKNMNSATYIGSTTVVQKNWEQREESDISHVQHTVLFEQRTTAHPSPIFQEPDENIPKSTPKHENDQYIRKRMIIAGSAYCNTAVLSRLKIGSYIKLEAEPDNPHDKDAVKLIFEGEKIGYIAKNDRLAFITCIKLKRAIYGVITDIISEDNFTKYEYETWFESD